MLEPNSLQRLINAKSKASRHETGSRYQLQYSTAGGGFRSLEFDSQSEALAHAEMICSNVSNLLVGSVCLYQGDALIMQVRLQLVLKLAS